MDIPSPDNPNRSGVHDLGSLCAGPAATTELLRKSGALGLPAKDGTLQAKMIEANFCREYAQTPVTELWPNLDVPPEVAKAAAGKPLGMGEPVFMESAVSASL